ncbi:MAG TPA: zinc ribbon domain-containing protein [Phycisphaerae bacterium]|jgi:hypothetical protein|nr:zinc ribbon domain-containing protein [Phycisphaerae bacterium]HOB74181.1 zinc ribbon domain-containing protein [Phycisphaerae bacterium]HOJ54968.1 zinc ribbon domain-containing protein [Phycisphaerae bacterium]HOL27010.1 zinc ribbon domain-containing protein [Phycisphaerae bacterium]HPP21439.1 zinc ribbon domain-containing protein [Phycisphaerae bacterium]
MPGPSQIDPDHESTRDALRVVGPLIAVVGGLFALVGFVSFFSSFGSFEPPRFFWCAFVGLPLLGFGVMITKAGYMGKIARYKSAEITPVATDTLKYAARESQDSIRQIAKAVHDGIAGAQPAPPAELACLRCLHKNDPDARFCSQCGSALVRPQECSNCGHGNDFDANFCDNCGRALNA